MRHSEKPRNGDRVVVRVQVSTHTKAILDGVRHEPEEALDVIRLLLEAHLAGGTLPPNLTEKQEYIICGCALAKLVEATCEVLGDTAIENIARDN